MRFRGRLAAIGAVLALSACNGSIVYWNYYASAYYPGQVLLAAANNPALAVIRGNPFANDADNAGVLAAMQGRNFGPKIYFGQTPRPDDKYGYKVVLDFGAAGYAYASACEAGPAPPSPRPPGERIDVSGAFCVGNVLLTDASGSVGGATGPDDPRFRRLIGDIMVALTPPYDPSRGGDHDCGGPEC